MPPPDPEMERAALAGSPTFQNIPYTEDIGETAADRQAEKLRRLYCFCQATACTIASLAFSVSR